MNCWNSKVSNEFPVSFFCSGSTMYDYFILAREESTKKKKKELPKHSLF